MRDVLLLLVLGVGLPTSFLRPWVGVGVLLWCWVALMSPHKLTWGFSSAPIGQIVGLTTLAGIMFFQRDTRPLPWRSPVVLMLALWGWTAVTTVFAIYPEEAWNRLGEISAMLLFMFLSMMLFQNLRRLKYLIYVLVGSLAFYGAKGAIFSLLGGAKYIVYGPRSPIFTDNNHLALALNMVLPLLIFLARNEPGRHARWAWGGTAAFTILAILFTYSRGGLVGLAVVIGAILLRSRQRIVAVVVAVLVLVLTLVLAPDRWFDRVRSIASYNQDASVTGHFNSWVFAWRLALDRPSWGAVSRFINLKSISATLLSPTASMWLTASIFRRWRSKVLSA